MPRKKEGMVVTQIRLSTYLYDELRRICGMTGDSLNGTMLNMIALGLRLYSDGVMIPKKDQAE